LPDFDNWWPICGDLQFGSAAESRNANDLLLSQAGFIVVEGLV
jgi:hypothetical protein